MIIVVAYPVRYQSILKRKCVIKPSQDTGERWMLILDRLPTAQVHLDSMSMPFGIQGDEQMESRRLLGSGSSSVGLE